MSTPNWVIRSKETGKYLSWKIVFFTHEIANARQFRTEEDANFLLAEYVPERHRDEYEVIKCVEENMKREDWNRACKWHEEHKEHVRKLVKEARTTFGYAPSGSDVIRPELWTAEHWKWFLFRDIPAGELRK